MALGIIVGLTRMYRRKRTSSLDILTSKRGPKDFYKGKNCKPNFAFLGGKNYTPFSPQNLKPYVSQCATEIRVTDSS